MKSKIINPCNVYTLLWCLFHLKGILYSADAISLVIYAIIMVMSLYYAAIIISRKSTPKFVNAYSVLLGLFVIYGIVNILFFEDVNKNGHIFPTDFYLQNILKSMLPFYAYYTFAKKGMINRSWLCYASILFFMVGIGRYFLGEEYALESQSQFNNEDGVTNNAGYVFAALIPIACFWNNKVIRYVYLMICSLFIILCMKRGAIVVGVVSLVYFVFESNRHSTTKKRFLNIILLFGLVYALYVFVLDMMMSSDYFVQRIDDTLEGQSSQRSFLYVYFWNLFWKEGNVFNYILGFGADSTIRYGHNYAHNDWIEILMNQGLMGIFLFVLFWIYFFKLWKSLSKNSVLKIIAGLCLLQIFAKTFFSMAINNMEIYLTLVMGVIVAATHNSRFIDKLNAKL